MARRGLVSKGSGPQGGNAALVPKGEKPAGPALLPIAEVAKRLGVEIHHVEQWIAKNQLRGSSSGVKPYDLKKFELDSEKEIDKAKRFAHQEKKGQNQRQAKKGFLSKFRSLFGSQPENGGQESSVRNENQSLKLELEKLRKELKTGAGEKSNQSNKDQDEKIKFLEKKLSASRDLELEVRRLQKEVQNRPASTDPSSSQNNEELNRLQQEMQRLQQELSQNQQIAAKAESFMSAISQIEKEKEQLQSELADMQKTWTDPQSFEALRLRLDRLENEPRPSSPSPTDQALVSDLLELQKINLNRFQTLHAQYLEAQCHVESLQKNASLVSQETATLSSNSSSNEDELREALEELSKTKAQLANLQSEFRTLEDKWKIAQENSHSSAEMEATPNQGHEYKSQEIEVASLRKNLLGKENQIQKVVTKLAENEKRLSKALQESGRLTELLMEKETRLRDLSAEIEQEYRDKIENLDRQVSGLQWKLSLREERISNLELELGKKK